MTTVVTLKTHDWPVDVTTTDRYDRTLTTTVETVEPFSEREFQITNNRSIAFDELTSPAQQASLGSSAA